MSRLPKVKPRNTGIKRTSALSRTLRNERYTFKIWSNKKLTEAEQSTETMTYVTNKFTPEERVARELKSIYSSVCTVYD